MTGGDLLLHKLYLRFSLLRFMLSPSPLVSQITSPEEIRLTSHSVLILHDPVR
jgi:hypothetical protein